MPTALRDALVRCILGDLFCCFLIDRLLKFLLGDAQTPEAK
jgi:hypothetical protein